MQIICIFAFKNWESPTDEYKNTEKWKKKNF